MRRFVLCVLGLCLTAGAAASASSGKSRTLALYEEGQPVSLGAKLNVEIQGFCGSGWTPERWEFAAQLSATHAKTVAVSIEPPGEASCDFVGPHVVTNRAELKEIHLKTPGTAYVIGVFRSFRAFPEPEFRNCEYEFHNAKGRFELPGAVSFLAATFGREVMRCPQRKQRQKVKVVVRGTGGKTLEIAPG